MCRVKQLLVQVRAVTWPTPCELPPCHLQTAAEVEREPLKCISNVLRMQNYCKSHVVLARNKKKAADNDVQFFYSLYSAIVFPGCYVFFRGAMKNVMAGFYCILY